MQQNNIEKQTAGGKSKPSGSLDALTQERATKSNAIEIPQISLPKGGGALKGIDEKFQVNPSNGTSSFSIPLPLSPNRNGFNLALSISYNSGAGNSVLGIGWGLDLPSIQRKTDKKLPRYRDYSTQPDEEDVFMFSGVEDLVPKLEKKILSNVIPVWEPVNYSYGEYQIREYRPRIEGSFSRIECIHHNDHGMYWRVTTRDNVTTIFGRSPECRITNPEDDNRIFQWLPEMSFDDKGSVVLFEYKKENMSGVGNVLHEKNRINEKTKFINRYLKRVHYGNAVPFYPYDQKDPSPHYDPPLPPSDTQWLFDLVFDYGEHDTESPKPDDMGEWITRPDPFSSYRPGFEIRTWRLLKRVIMFHRFPELNDNIPTLVRSLDFKHLISDSELSGKKTELEFLVSITQSGYILRNGSYSKKSLPPLEFNYQPLTWNQDVHEVQQKDLLHSPVGLSSNYQWVDLYSEGISGILTEQGGGWYYKHNLGETDGDRQVAFEPARLVAPKPSFTGLSGGVLQLQDLESNGRKQIVVNAPGIQGYFELSDDGEWEPLHAFLRTVNINLRDPNVRLFDINGDGQPEIVLSEEQAFCWWPAKGKEGYGTPERAGKSFDEEEGPAIVFSDLEQRIFLADMSGDGLSDIVRIRNGEICYWPNLGYGRFGAKVAMSNAPWFDHPDQFNPSYLQLADISGTGATDLIYLGKNQFRAWLNLSGNSWGDAEEITPFFPVEQPNRLTVTDLLGNGTACIVWSSELPAYSNSPMRYMNLMGGQKPHIMTGYRNNFGKEVTMNYRSSTHYYLKDKLEGNPWITRLPFPVQVVQRVEVSDMVTGVLFINKYSYHHGYYDHFEREFRGFGRVDQYDTEDFENWAQPNASNGQSGKERHEPPVLTKTWFHTGSFLSKEKILRQFDQEYWYNGWNRLHPEAPVTEHILPDALIDTNVMGDDFALPVEELCEALRACKGMTLRQEVFALDGSDKETLPYTVATHNCHIHLVQPKGDNQHASFMALESEAMSWSYERNPDDPRIGHTFNIKVDDLGNVLQAVSVVYPRKEDQKSHLPDFKLAAEDIGGKDPPVMQARHQEFIDNVQHQLHVILTENDFTNNVSDPDAYRLRLPSAVRTYEIKGMSLPDQHYFSLEDLKNNYIDNALATTYEDTDTPEEGIIEKRLIEHVITRYRSNDLSGSLAKDKLESLAIPFESYQLAFTPELLRKLYGDKLPDADWQPVLEKQGRFECIDNENLWISSGKTLYPPLPEAKAQFYLPDGYEDPFETITRVGYDPYWLTILWARDTVENETYVERIDYRTLAPERLRDPNGNFSESISDELGLPVATAIFSKPDTNGEWEGDTLDQGNWNFDLNRIIPFFGNPVDEALNLLQTATACMVYDFSAYPARVATVARETHFHTIDAEGTPHINSNPLVQISFEYSDGLGKVALKKVRVEPGDAWHVERDAEGNCKAEIVNADPRWVGNGRTILNNKGKPIRQYEPYFSDTHNYEDEPCVRHIGVTPELYYDPVGRLIRTEFPNGTLTKVVFSSWEQCDYDPNDTIGERKADGTLENTCLWYDERISGDKGDNELRAAKISAGHADTPSVIFLDSLGRPVYGLAHNRWEVTVNDRTQTFERFHPTMVVLDIEGNVREVWDARDNCVMTYDYDMLGHRLNQNSMDAGRRWILHDCMGQPLYAWDERDFIFSYTYDKLHRPFELKVRGGDGKAMDHIYQKTIYGEDQTDDKKHNLRGQVWWLYDTAGCVETPDYDFKGNPLKSIRRLARDYKSTPDWSAYPEPLLETEIFPGSIQYDALNRAILNVTPDGSITVPSFNEAGLLEKVEVIQGTITRTMVTNINYNEKGQRTYIEYGNGVITSYEYDRQTFRLVHLNSYRSGDPPPKEPLLQDLYYTYDPVGNITHIEDRAIPTVFYGNFKVEPAADYTYDSLYQLISATGREHIGQVLHGEQDNWDDSWAKESLQPGSPVQLRSYTQLYSYDPAGNIQCMSHKANGGKPNGGNWTRDYAYQNQNNRLMNTSVSGNTYNYPHHPQHGFMTGMPHLQRMDWNFLEQLQATSRQSVSNGGTPETTWYVYDGTGQRIRKVTENYAAPGTSATLKSERIYLGSCEVYRQYDDTAAGLERWTLHVMDDKQRIAMIETRNEIDDGTAQLLLRYQFGNHLGSTVLELDDKAQVISYEEYHPYGTTAYQAMNVSIKSAAKRYRYTGMERDEETGLAYHGARYYVPWLGRWTSKDPVLLVDDLNLFVFDHNNSVLFQDRNGKQAELSWLENFSIEVLKFNMSVNNQSLVGSSQSALEWVRENANSAGDVYLKPNPLREFRKQCIKRLYRFTGFNEKIAEEASQDTEQALAATEAIVNYVVLRAIGETVLVGPNIVVGLHSGGTNIGQGLARGAKGVASGNIVEQLLGFAQFLGGLGEGAAATASVLSMTKPPNSTPKVTAISKTSTTMPVNNPKIASEIPENPEVLIHQGGGPVRPVSPKRPQYLPDRTQKPGYDNMHVGGGRITGNPDPYTVPAHPNVNRSLMKRFEILVKKLFDSGGVGYLEYEVWGTTAANPTTLVWRWKPNQSYNDWVLDLTLDLNAPPPYITGSSWWLKPVKS